MTLLAGALIAVKAAGASVGWGFQLQSPWFVALLALLFVTITLNLAGIKTNTEVTGVKAVAEETLDVNGTSIDCVVIENTTVSKVIGIKQTAIQKIWYGHGIGPVKTNMYNKKGKLMTSQELVSIEGL